jgi:hypothetical protein
MTLTMENKTMSSTRNSPENKPQQTVAHDNKADPVLTAAAAKAAAQNVADKKKGEGDHPKGMYPSVGR